MKLKCCNNNSTLLPDFNNDLETLNEKNKKVRTKSLLKRYKGNPVLTPNPTNKWESFVTTNPGVWYDPEEKTVYMLYRASGKDFTHKVCLGLAKSKDGFNFERVSDTPSLSGAADGIDAGAIEDPRIVKFGEWYYVTYASRPFPGGQYWLPPEKKTFKPERMPDDFPEPLRSNHLSTSLAFTKDFKKWIRAGIMTDRNVFDHDVIIFPEKIHEKYAILSRPDFSGSAYEADSLSIWLSLTDDLLDISERKIIAHPRFEWENRVIGGNTPPIKTDCGWLVIYHGVSADGFYRLGAMLLDLNDPFRVTHRTPEPIFEPQEDYELKGPHSYNGVVFPCGNAVIDGTYYLYYGAADKYVAVATCKLKELLINLKENPA